MHEKKDLNYSEDHKKAIFIQQFTLQSNSLGNGAINTEMLIAFPDKKIIHVFVTFDSFSITLKKMTRIKHFIVVI